MKKIFLSGFLVLFSLSLFSQTEIASPDSLKINVAKMFLDKLVAKDFTNAMTFVDWDLAGKINSSALQNIWSSLEQQSGNYKACIDRYTEAKDDFTIVFQTCQFEKATLDIKTTINKQNKVAGIFIVAPKSKEVYRFPDYANTKEVLETDMIVMSGKYELPATITYPKSGSRLPAIVLVHGSGPNDKDETVGHNKIFKDLAYGLSSKGFLVLRYEKRTKQYGAELMDMIETITLKEETIDDAIAATNEAKKIVAVDPARVYVLGHSLGGMCAPRIASQTTIAGIIMMAANARPLEDLIMEQMTYILSLDGNSKEDSINLEQLKVQVMNVKILDKNSDIDAWQLPLSLSKNYWFDLNNYQQTEAAKNLTIPILVLQGARDYQVTTTDYKLWQKALAGKSNAAFKLYDKLNHLFIEGSGKSTPAEYNKAGNIPEYVITDIANFCK